MPRKGANVSLSSYDDIFSTEQSRTEAGQEHVQEIGRAGARAGNSVGRAASL